MNQDSASTSDQDPRLHSTRSDRHGTWPVSRERVNIPVNNCGETPIFHARADTHGSTATEQWMVEQAESNWVSGSIYSQEDATKKRSRSEGNLATILHQVSAIEYRDNSYRTLSTPKRLKMDDTLAGVGAFCDDQLKQDRCKSSNPNSKHLD